MKALIKKLNFVQSKGDKWFFVYEELFTKTEIK